MTTPEARLNLGAILTSLTNIDEIQKHLTGATTPKSTLPTDFQNVATLLPLIRSILVSTTSDITDSLVSPTFHLTAVPLLQSCDTRTSSLKDVVVKAYPSTPSKASRFLKGVTGLGKGSSAKNLMRGLLQDVQHLTDGSAVPSVTAEQRVQVHRAIMDLDGLLKPSKANTNMSGWLYEENRPSTIVGMSYGK